MTDDSRQNILPPEKKSFQQAMNTAVRILTQRDHSKYELIQKLQQRGFAAKIVDTVIAQCKELGYIDDRRTARIYVLQLKRKCFGRRYIRLALKKKRLMDSANEEILVENYPQEDEYVHAGQLLEKKKKTFASEADPQKRSDRIYRFLYSRGFSASVIRELVNS